MRIILDSNIIIPLEDSSRALHESLGEFSRLANQHGHTLLVHPASTDDIKRDTDETRREISLSRLRKYPFLEQPPVPTPNNLTEYQLSQTNDNDRVDNEILFAILKNTANILVSEDRKLHSKAARLGLRDRVHYIQQAVDFLRRLHTTVNLSFPNIEETPLYQIELGLEFFDSLRDDYDSFNKWYEKAAREGRKAWVHKNDKGELGALCIFNTEYDPIVTDGNKAIPGKVLKLCTFKVSETVRGRRVGELFLKASFQYATQNGTEHIYLHTRRGKQDFLIDFIKEFGFDFYGEYKNDAVYVKEHPAIPVPSTLHTLDYHKKYFPLFMGVPSVGKYIVPIRPEYHKILFPDNQRQLLLFPYGSHFGQKIVGNAIRQAYLCHARIGGLKAGDILLFYRSCDQRAITSIGIVELTGDYENVDEIIQIVSKRTVYSHNEIRGMAEKKTKVILFRIASHLQYPIPFRWLKNNAIVNGNIQTIQRITNESFRKITDKGAVQNCLYAN